MVGHENRDRVEIEIDFDIGSGAARLGDRALRAERPCSGEGPVVRELPPIAFVRVEEVLREARRRGERGRGDQGLERLRGRRCWQPVPDNGDR